MGGVGSVGGVASDTDTDGGSCVSPVALSASLLWKGLGYDGYKFYPGYFGFSRDGGQFASPGRALTEYEVGTGAMAPIAAFSVTSRDRAWAREVVAGQVLDVESRRVLLEAGTYAIAALSGDGRYFFWLDGDCAKDSVAIHRRGIDTYEQGALALVGFCDGAWSPTLAVTASGSAALVANGNRTLWHADFEGDAVSSIQTHERSTRAYTGMSITLSPDDRWLATIGDDDGLRTWTYPALEPVLADIPVAWTKAFDWCYCRSFELAPIAWSADGSLLASPDAAGNAVIRRACDGQILATLPSPERGNRPASPGPMFLAFAPSETGLAVGFEAGLTYFGLSAGEPTE